MKNVRATFDIFDSDVNDLKGYLFVECHMIFDINMGENFQRRSQMVAGSHMTTSTSYITYSSVVSRESFRITLTIGALKNHRFREAVAAGNVRIANQDTEKNIADLFTKTLTAGRREFLSERFTY